MDIIDDPDFDIVGFDLEEIVWNYNVSLHFVPLTEEMAGQMNVKFEKHYLVALYNQLDLSNENDLNKVRRLGFRIMDSFPAFNGEYQYNVFILEQDGY